MEVVSKNQMDNRTKDFILTIIPFIMLFLTGLSGLVYETDWYNNNFMYLGDAVGYSILTNLGFLLIYTRKSFCVQTKIAVFGLLVMNVISLMFIHNDWLYDKIYDLWITIFLTIVITLTLIKWKR